MHHPTSRRDSVRFWRRFLIVALAVLALVPAVWGQDGAASARPAPAENFWAALFDNIIHFNTRGLFDLLKDPRFAVSAFIAVNLIVFVETGLLIGFFLPGDSLLVTTGLIAHEYGWNMPLLLVSVSLAAIIGDTIGYSIGYKTGPMIFSREKSFFFKRDHLLAAQAFYEKHGGKTIILARFIPILRTFAPVVAGVGRMEYRRFLSFNIVGGIGWVCSMILIGYFLPAVINPMFQQWLGEEFEVKNHIEKVVFVVVFLSILPGIVMWMKNKLSGGPGPTRRDEVTTAV